MPVIRACSHCGRKNRIPAKNLTGTARCRATAALTECWPKPACNLSSGAPTGGDPAERPPYQRISCVT
jgi:hypothetical protein